MLCYFFLIEEYLNRRKRKENGRTSNQKTRRQEALRAAFVHSKYYHVKKGMNSFQELKLGLKGRRYQEKDFDPK